MLAALIDRYGYYHRELEPGPIKYRAVAERYWPFGGWARPDLQRFTGYAPHVYLDCIHILEECWILCITAQTKMSVPKDMLAARCLKYLSSPPLDLVRTPLPVPGAKEVLIKVSAASLCHTDVAMCMGDKINEGNTVPQTAGHEPCGTIVQVGADVTGLQVGDRVGFVNHAGSCGAYCAEVSGDTYVIADGIGECEECKKGLNTYCLNARTKLRGVNTDGCFSEYAIGDAVYTFKIPNKLSDAEAAPLMCG
jgi:D-arabinose 1-dehydrogenase-like Zn-dependent alcohol dehydrogenase